LAARKQRRSISSFIEFAIESTLHNVNIVEGGYNEAPMSIGSIADQLWDVYEPDRFLKLAIRHPEILTYAEQILWKQIRETPGLWRGRYDSNNEWVWKIAEDALMYDRVRLHWDVLKKIARGEASKTQLPVWIWDKRKPKGQQSSAAAPGSNLATASPMDDEDIPF